MNETLNTVNAAAVAIADLSSHVHSRTQGQHATLPIEAWNKVNAIQNALGDFVKWIADNGHHINPMSPQSVAAATLGKLGGKSTSPAKQRASRENGKKHTGRSKTTIHYSAKGQNTHDNQGHVVTTETHFNGIVRHVGNLSDESVKSLAAKHATRRGLELKSINTVFHT